MGPMSHTPIADMIRAIGLSRAEAVELLAPHGFSPASIDHMCSGRTKADPEAIRILAQLWQGIDLGLPLEGSPESMKRRRDNILTMRALAE
jgi:hypothetical protein